MTISQVVRSFGHSGDPFATCDVSGMFWADVDTYEDYTAVDAILSE